MASQYKEENEWCIYNKMVNQFSITQRLWEKNIVDVNFNLSILSLDDQFFSASGTATWGVPFWAPFLYAEI